MRTSKRDAEILALHAIVVAQGQSAGYKVTGGTWWVFTSHAVSGEVIFTYKHTQGVSPGAAWARIPPERVDAFLTRCTGEDEFEVRAGRDVNGPETPQPYRPPAPLGRTGLAEAAVGSGTVKVGGKPV